MLTTIMMRSQALNSIRAVATGGVYREIPPPKSVYLKFFMWLFCLLAMTYD